MGLVTVAFVLTSPSSLIHSVHIAQFTRVVLLCGLSLLLIVYRRLKSISSPISFLSAQLRDCVAVTDCKCWRCRLIRTVIPTAAIADCEPTKPNSPSFAHKPSVHHALPFQPPPSVSFIVLVIHHGKCPDIDDGAGAPCHTYRDGIGGPSQRIYASVFIIFCVRCNNIALTPTLLPSPPVSPPQTNACKSTATSSSGTNTNMSSLVFPRT